MFDLKDSFRRFAVFSAIAFLLSLAFSLVVNRHYVSDVFLYLVPFFFITGLLTRWALYSPTRFNGKKFSVIYIIITMVRLIFYLLIMVGYSLMFRADAYAFMIAFFVLYVFFAIFEIFEVYKVLKQ